MQIKYSKLIVKDASGNLIQLLPETKVDVVLDSTSSFPIANSAVTQAINNISANISTYQGATTEAAGVPGFVPSATSAQKDYFLKGDGSWSQVTDTKVTNTLNTTALAYITGTTSSSTNTGEQVFDSNVYLTTTAGTLHATNFEGKLNNKAESDFVYTSGNQTISGQKTFSEGPYGTVKDMASGSTIDLSQGNVFKKTISANTTFTITNVPQGKVATFSLVLTNGGSKTITWPSSVNWGGDSPELNSSGTDVLTFLTPDGGTTWYGSLSVGGVPITYDSAISSSSQNAVQNQVIYSALNAKANDNNVVHLDGAETITGVKTFSNNININSLQYIGDRTFTIGTVDADAGSYLQINSLVDSKSVTVANQGTNNITLSTKGHITATGTVTANSFSGNGASVTNLNASNLSSGTIPIERLPAGALERLVVVSSLSAMYALTTNDVQLGDTVKDANTGIMYYVKDASNLNSEAGYEEYTAGAATSVPWSGVTDRGDKLSDYGITDAKIENGTITLGSNTITPLTSHLTADGTALTITSNKISHTTTTGYKHIPTGGSSGQFLGWDSDGTAKWVKNPNADTKVTQNKSTTDDTYPVLLTPTANANSNQGAKTSIFANGVKVNPSTNALTAGLFIGQLDKKLTIKIKSPNPGTEGIHLYTFDNLTDKTLDIKEGNNITLTAEEGSLTIAATDTTYSAASDGGLSLSGTAFSLANSGVTADSYGPSDNATPDYGATFNVPYITVDAKGRVTAASTKTVKIPASDNTDTLMTQNVSTNNNTYPILLTPTANANSNQGAKTSIFANGVKVNPSTNTITANDFYGRTNTITTNTINVSTGTCFVKTITANCTLSFTNAPSNVFCCITLVLINGGSKTITWPSSVKWTNNTVPDFSTSGTDVITLMTYNGGTTWYATAACMGVTA